MCLNYNLYAALVAAAVVFILSVVGSFVVWVNAQADGIDDNDSQATRWKWMCVVFLIVFACMQMAKP